jgi:hypothetical protein
MKRSTIIQLGIIVLLAVAVFFVLRRPGETSGTGLSGNVLVRFDSTSVDRLEIRSAKDSIARQKEGNSWRMVYPIRYRANESAVKAALEKSGHIQLENVVSDNPQKQGLFQVDSTGTLVRVFENGSEKTSFLIGKPSSSYAETYVRRAGSDDVYLAQGVLTYTFNRPVRDWRDKIIFKAEQENMHAIRFHYGDTTFALANVDSAWRVDNDSASPASVRSFLTALGNFQADDFIDTALPAMPRLTAMIDVDGVQIQFFPEKDAGKYVVRTSDSPQLFEVQNWRASQLLKKKKDFLATPA